MRLRRINSELVRRKLAQSRARAQETIAEGRVKLDGEVVMKSARQMNPAQVIVIAEPEQIEYVSREAHKLTDALNSLGEAAPIVKRCRCLDAGASTGGFTDVLLRRGAASVVAIDVGYRQLARRFQSNPRAEVRDHMNVRTMRADDVDPVSSLVVGNVFFISLTLVIPALAAVAAEDADFLLMVKPQFEVGKERLGHGGIVRSLEHHVETVESVARCATNNDLEILAVEASSLPGPSGNVGYFLHMRTGDSDAVASEELHSRIEDAVRRGLTDEGEDTR